MPNPAAVSDAAEEWFEVFNSRSDVAVDINGWTMRDLGTNAHTINNGAPLVVPPQGFLVMGRNADTVTNGGVTVDYRYAGFTLGNTADQIELVDVLGTVIDTVAYTSSIVFNGASSGLAPSAFNTSANDILANWCAAVSLMPGGDKGTPGAANDTCALAGDVADPSATADLYGNAPSYSGANGGTLPDPNRAADTYARAHCHAVTYTDCFGGKCGGTWDGVRHRDHAESCGRQRHRRRVV